MSLLDTRTHNGLALATEGFSWTMWELLVLQDVLQSVPRSTFNKGLVTLEPALNIKQAHQAALFSALDKLHLRCSDCSPLD